jgi:hypothetical protein
VELCDGSAVLLACAARRSCGCRFPLPEHVVAALVVEVPDRDDGDGQASVVRGAGWRCYGSEDHRLPGRSGAPPSPSKEWRSGGRFRRRSVQHVDGEAGIQEVLIVIFFVSWVYL